MVERGFDWLLTWPHKEGLVESARLQLDPHSNGYYASERYSPKVERERCPKFTSKNHRFYVGKSFPERQEDDAGNGYFRQPAIYGEDTMLGLLSILFDHLEEGEQAQLVICPEFSEWFNGKDGDFRPMTPEEQKAWIYSLAQKKLKRGGDSLKVMSIGEDSRHSELTAAIRSSQDSRTGLCDVKHAFATDSPASLDASDSLTIARFLFSVAQRNVAFRGALYGTLPTRIKGGKWARENFHELDDDTQLQRISYPLTELSVRISDLLSGCEYQGGVERQTVYDELIYGLFQANTNTGLFRKITDLKSLVDLLKDHRFSGIYLDQKKNYFPKRKQQIEARVRLGVRSVLGLAALSGAYWIGGIDQREIEARQAAYLDTCLAEKMPGLPIEVRKSHFEKMLRTAEEEFAHRYSLPYYRNDGVVASFTDFLCDGSFFKADLDRVGMRDQVDDFAQNHRYLLTSDGGRIGAPYSALDGYKELFAGFIEKDLSSMEPCISDIGGYVAIAEILNHEGAPLLLFQSQIRTEELYTAYSLPPPERPARSHQPITLAEPRTCYSQLKAQDTIRELVAIRERYEARRATPFFDAAHWDFETTSLPPLVVDCDQENSGCLEKTSYPGFLGPDFELALYPSEGHWIPVARETGETLYSYSTALKAWQRYNEHHPSFSGDHP